MVLWGWFQKVVCTWFTKSGMYVVYKKWYVGGLHKKVLISGLGINFWPQPAVGFYVNHQHTIFETS